MFIIASGIFIKLANVNTEQAKAIVWMFAFLGDFVLMIGLLPRL